MLDVHPPHTATHTWRDFFIHIATIVVGLLIAVGLEQTVEYIHHRRELARTRHALDNEIEVDRAWAAAATGEFRRFVPILQTDLRVLHYLETHPAAPMSQWPGEYRLRTYGGGFFSDTWNTARQNNIVALMPDEEAARYADVFERFNDLDRAEHDRTAALTDLRAVTMEDPDPSHLSPERLRQAIDAVRKVLVVEAVLARELYNLSYSHPELYVTAPTPEERLGILPVLKTPHDEVDAKAVSATLKPLVGNGNDFRPKETK